EQDQGKITTAVNLALEQGKPFDLEVKLKMATGNTIWVRTIGAAEIVNGTCKKLYGTFQNIDKQKKAEQALINEKLRLTAFVEHSPAAVAMMDTELRYVAVSDRWKTDYHIKADVIGKSE